MLVLYFVSVPDWVSEATLLATPTRTRARARARTLGRFILLGRHLERRWPSPACIPDLGLEL